MAKKTKGTLPSGSIRYRLYIGVDPDGKKLYKSFTAATKSDAKRLAEKWKEEHSRMPLSVQNPTFSEAAALFLRNRSKTLSPSTYADYVKRIRFIEDVAPLFAKTRMSVMSSEHVQALINDLSSRPVTNTRAQSAGKGSDRTMSAKSVKNSYRILSVVLRAQGIDLAGIKLPQMRRPELNIPENETVTRLLEAVRGTELEIPILLAAWGPMRRGEICALRLEDIDFETNTVHVCRNMVQDSTKEWVIKLPKTASGDRYITYPAYVIDLIKERGHIVKYHPDMLSVAFARALDRNGIAHFRFHDLRHFAASFQIALGIPPEYVMERGGWHSPGTMQRYVHALDQQRREMADKANAAFANLL